MKTLVHLLALVALGCNVAQGQVISEPDDVTACEGREAVFTCVLNSTIRSENVQWYRFIKDTSTTEMVDPVGDNINFITDTIGNTTSSSLTITNVIKSYIGYFWVVIPSLEVCNASLTVLARPSALTVNLTKKFENSSIVVQWDAVDDSLITTYTLTWTRAGGSLQVATVIEQTSYTITGLTLNIVYAISVTASNMCGSGSGFNTSVSLSAVTISTSSSISPNITASTKSIRISIATISSTIVTTTTNPMTTSATANTTTITMINPSITTTNSVNTTENKNITTTRSSTNTETTNTAVNITKQFTDAVFLSTSPVETNMADENSDSSNIPIIAGAAIGGIIVVTIIIVLIIFIVFCYFQQKKNTEKNNYNDLPGDDTLTKNIPVALNPLNADDKSIAESSPQMSTTVEGLYMTSDIGNKKPPPSYNPLQSTPQNGRIDTQHQQSAEYAAIDDVKKNEDKQQNGERDNQHQPMEYAVVDKSKKKSRKEDKQQNAETDTKQQQLMEYAVVDKSIKKNKKGDIQQDVEAVHHDDGTIPSIDDHTYANANQNKNNPLLHYADLDTLPSATGAYVAADDSRTPYALVAET